MADRPILFSAPMVRALLGGTKTQTRRQIKPRGKRPSLFNGDWSDSYVLDPGNQSWRDQDIRVHAGDRLWVKETWAPLSALTHNDPGTQALADKAFYRADGSTVEGEISAWKPSIFMPRTASRITLLVTEVRVERLNDISETDALAEGCSKRAADATGFSNVDEYQKIWGAINGPGSWNSNPWVAAYTFSVIKSNIDQIGGDA